MICTFGDGRVLVSGRYYNYLELTAVEPELAEVEEGAVSESVAPSSSRRASAMPYAIAASVEAMPKEILANECKPLAQTSNLISGEATRGGIQILPTLVNTL